MIRLRLTHVLAGAFALTLLGPPATAAAQEPDWTLSVPVRLEQIPPEVDAVQVRCAVSSNPDEFGSAFSEDLGSNDFVGSPGGPIREFDDAMSPPHFFGVQEVAMPAGGRLNQSVNVLIWAPDGTSDAEKSAVTGWSCALGLKVGNFVAFPGAPVTDEWQESIQPRPGTSPTVAAAGPIG